MHHCVEHEWSPCVVAACLPEGVRLLTVFLSADEYRDLMQCSGSSAEPTVRPADRVRETGSERHHIVHADSHNEHAAAAAEGDIVTEDRCRRADGEDSAEVFLSSHDTESLSVDRSQHSDTAESGVGYKSSAIPGEYVCSLLAAHDCL